MINTNKDNILNSVEIGSLFDEVQKRILKMQKRASMATKSASFSPIEEVGARIRKERNKQKLTLLDLCELSDVSYATLIKIEQGNSNARLNSLVNITRALGMKIWIG